MKKKLITIISFIMSLFMSVMFISGCNLVTTDSERDMNRVVATISIDKEVKDEILKKDLVMAYLNYGYIYSQYYGYTQEKTFNLIIDNLINTKILVQNAMSEFDGGVYPFDEAVADSSKAQWNYERYLTEDEKTEAKYETLKSINDLIESYANTDKKDLKGDTVSETVRTVPTGATNKSTDPKTVSEKKEYLKKGFKLDNRDAVNDVVELFKTNNILGSKYDGNLENTEYYDSLLKNNYESKILNKYESLITYEARQRITFGKLEQSFVAKLNEQKEFNATEFAQALANASNSEPILYSAFGTYGYVYNLLLGASDAQKEEIEGIDKANKTDAEITQARRDILDKTIVKDLRSTWIQSGYDFDGEKFTGDYTFVKDAKYSLPFQGVVKDITPIGEEVKKYGVESVTNFSLDGFIEMMHKYVYDTNSFDVSSIKTESGDIYAEFDGAASSEYDAKINELLFAFSTDDGSLNTYKGYVIKPAVDGSNQEEYVKTFADAGRKLLEKGENSYIIVASDYGYHVMFYSEVFTEDTTLYTDLVEYLNANFDLDTGKYATWRDYYKDMLENYDTWEDDGNYLYLLFNSLYSNSISNALNAKENEVINNALYDYKYVTKYEKVYADLLGK